ncbi:hypothetical protein BV898_10694 [Hypsibius exemplaris]|uniref:Protein kinase domain-containing protein n=1 Tax=Hypsibius exemplaris TaxID=2072580 RepID=A0A1W0WIY2_HYPEX|nr:hypothetical protein BV898_10694 [Hypsibius exemplaris]
MHVVSYFERIRNAELPSFPIKDPIWSPTDSGFGDSVLSFASQEDVHEESLRASTCCENYVEVRDWAVDYADLEVKAKVQQNATGDFHRQEPFCPFPRCNSTSTHTAATASRNYNYLTSFLAPEVLPLYSAAAGCGNNNVSSSSVYTEATDSFAFGSLLYEIFTEQKPFKSLAEREQFAALLDRSDIPSNVQEVIGQCWNRNPADRPSFPEILDSLTNRQPFLLSGRSFSQPDLFAQQSRAM